jgi:hypothetical protein
MNFPEYKDWAKAILREDADMSNWMHLTLAEGSARALAICEEAKDGSTDSPIMAFYHLEKFIESINKKYPWR